MRLFHFETRTRIARPRAEVFPFFSEARNLERITPPWLRFEVLTSDPIEMKPGTLIDYRLRIRGIPVRWRSEITAWEPPFRFVDEQRKGPYRLWHHEHRFEEEGEDTVMEDRVTYAVWGGALFDRLFVRRDVQRIFAYREETIAGLWPPKDRGARMEES